MDTLAFKLLDKNSFVLRVNTRIPNFNLFKEVLMFHNIPFKTWAADRIIKMDKCEMGFTAECDFKAIYLLAYIFKELGVETIYPSRSQSNLISIGTYIHKITDPEQYAIAEPIPIDLFLSIDPKFMTQFVIDNYFPNKYIYNKNEIATKAYDEPSDNYEDFDHAKESFNAMTDGQLGNYDDFEGDIDDVRAWSGRE
jgi:hypothetical protein